MIKIAPSILSADFANLGRDINRAMQAGADLIHVDIMDGHFVPNISFGPPVLKSIRAATDAFLDVHLMISQPEQYLDAFIKSGSDLINIHLESEGNIELMLAKIREAGLKNALTIKPKTPVSALLPYLDKIDMVLVMSVEPGFGGQSFMECVLEKIQELRQIIDERRLVCKIEVDGGITAQTAPQAILAGADILVAGSAVYGADDMTLAIAQLKK